MRTVIGPLPASVTQLHRWDLKKMRPGPCHRRAICWAGGLEVGFGAMTNNPGVGACRKLGDLFQRVGFSQSLSKRG